MQAYSYDLYVLKRMSLCKFSINCAELREHTTGEYGKHLNLVITRTSLFI